MIQVTAGAGFGGGERSASVGIRGQSADGSQLEESAAGVLHRVGFTHMVSRF
jgi:hypothetical protein